MGGWDSQLSSGVNANECQRRRLGEEGAPESDWGAHRGETPKDRPDETSSWRELSFRVYSGKSLQKPNLRLLSWGSMCYALHIRAQD